MMSVAATTAATSTTGSTSSLGSLTNNFSDFLKLLMTQLQNQDPTSPMDTNQFTSQLVQFASVEQQINTNTSLTKLIEATQGSNLLQASSLVGQAVSVTGTQLSLQNGTASLDFTASQATTVDVLTAAGSRVREATVAAGQRGWTWDGKDDQGKAMPDGVYTVAVKAADGATAVPFTVQGTVTGVQRGDGSTTVQLGQLAVDLGKVQSVAR